MALRFFRRRQKVVLLVMAFLMVGAGGIWSLASRGCSRADVRKFVEGEVDDTKITIGMRRAAAADIEVLTRSLGLGSYPPRRIGETEFMVFLDANRDDRTLPWTLLLHEAGKMGIRVTEADVDSFLASTGLVDKAYRVEVAIARERGITERQFRQAVADYLMITEAFSAARISSPPSIPELRHAFRDLNERIQLAMVIFPAAEFAKDLPDPSEQAARQWFEKHKHLARNDPGNKTTYGFGYLQPDRVKVSYLFVDQDIVRQAVEPPEQLMRDYWRRNKGQLKKKVPVPATSTAPTTGPTTQDTQPAEPKYVEVPYERYSQAKPEIREILKDQVAAAKTNELLAQAQERIAQAGPGEDAYAKAVASMIRPAGAILGRRIGPMPFRSAAIKTVIEHLAELAKVKIVYPLGQHGKRFLDPEVVVETKWKQLTLGEALERIGKKLGYSDIKWVTCETFEDAIFPSEPVNLVPVSAGRTGLLSLTEIGKHDILGWATVNAQGRGSTLKFIAGTAKEFQGPRRGRTSLVEVGRDFRQAMYVSGPRSGRLLWRLLAAEAAHAPEQLDSELLRQVREDLKIIEGFKRARKAAEEMKSKITTAPEDLEKLAKAEKREFVKTKFFPRRVLDYFGRASTPEVSGIGSTPEFINYAFRLVPADPDGPHSDRPAAVVPLYRQQKVVLIQRIGYEPAVLQDFETRGVYSVLPILSGQRQQRELLTWFTGSNIIRRVGYRPRNQEQ